MKLRFFAAALLVLTTGFTHAQADIQAELDAFVASIAPADGPAVSARITIGDETWAAAGGLAHIETGEAATPEDRFRIASMSKTWLAVTVMKLVEDGVVSLDDPVANWLPDDLIGQIENASQVTIFQLLTMTSGIPDYVGNDFFYTVQQDPQYPWTAEEALPYVYGVPASFAPGAGFEYVNTNYVLLQLIVEAATQQPMHEVMRAIILDPLELPDTCALAFEACSAIVSGYEDFDTDGMAEDLSGANYGGGLGDAALIATTADLTRFYQALFVNGELLSDESVELMVETGENENQYGIGLEVITGTYGLQLGHTGSMPGYSGAVYYAPELDTTVVILYASQGLDAAHTDALLAIAANAIGATGEADE